MRIYCSCFTFFVVIYCAKLSLQNLEGEPLFDNCQTFATRISNNGSGQKSTHLKKMGGSK